MHLRGVLTGVPGRGGARRARSGPAAPCQRVNRRERVLIVAPTRRDAEVTCKLLADAGIECQPSPGWPSWRRRSSRGAGVVVLTVAALRAPGIEQLVEAFAGQPAWSDLPLLLLSSIGDRPEVARKTPAQFSNVTVLDLPSSTNALLSAVQTALRARRRQYQIRTQIARADQGRGSPPQADKRKDEFLATLSHELRNPLGAGPQRPSSPAAPPARDGQGTARHRIDGPAESPARQADRRPARCLAHRHRKGRSAQATAGSARRDRERGRAGPDGRRRRASRPAGRIAARAGVGLGRPVAARASGRQPGQQRGQVHA